LGDEDHGIVGRKESSIVKKWMRTGTRTEKKRKKCDAGEGVAKKNPPKIMWYVAETFSARRSV